MGFINNANQIIGDNMRYLQQLQSNPQSAQTTSASSAATSSASEMQMLMPMLMMMMLQMMSQNSAQTGQNATYPTSTDPFGALPSAPPFPQFQSPQNPNNSTADPNAQQQWIQQNPAYQFLSEQLGGASTTNNSDYTILPPDFSDNASIATRMNSLLSTSPDTSLQSLGTQLLSGTLNATDPDALKAQVQNQMAQEGRNNNDVAEFGLLYDAMQNNNNLDAAEVQVAVEPTTTNAQTVAQLSQDQNQLAQDWQSLYPDNETATTTETDNVGDLTQSVQQALANGEFTPVQLGQSLKYLWDKAPASNQDALSNLTTNLMKSGELNIIPFLNSSYLDKLPASSQTGLFQAVQNAGLTLSNGQPNSRFAGFLLENLSRPEASSTQGFLQQFLQNDWQGNGANTSTAEGQALQNVLNLAGIQGTAGEPLTFA